MVTSDQCVGAGAAAVDTVGAPDLSQTAGLDSGCTDTGNADYGVWILWQVKQFWVGLDIKYVLDIRSIVDISPQTSETGLTKTR